MIQNPYQNYLWLIGKLKDSDPNISVDADHRDIHSFFLKKKPIFKLFYGKYAPSGDDSIVVSFHIDIQGPQAIVWFKKIQDLFPAVKLTYVNIEDASGETYLGEDAQAIKDLLIQQEVLKLWKGTSNKEVQEFLSSKVVGRIRDKKTFNSASQKDIEKAIIEFDLMKTPLDDGDIN